MTDNGDETDDKPVGADEAADRLPSTADFDAEFEDGEMTECEREAIDSRIDEIEDDDRQYSTEEVAEELGIDLDTDDDSLRVSRDLMGEPHIAGRRVPVRQLRALVEEGGENAAAVADRFDLNVADVYYALAYYHDHPREMHAVEREREVSRERVEKLDDDENLEEADALIDDLPDRDEE